MYKKYVFLPLGDRNEDRTTTYLRVELKSYNLFFLLEMFQFYLLYVLKSLVCLLVLF